MSSSSSDIQALLARITRPTPANNNNVGPGYDAPPHPPSQFQQPSPAPQVSQQFSDYRQPSFSSVYSASPVHTPPYHTSDVLSPNPLFAPRRESHTSQQPNPDNRAASLLNLLRFNQPAEPPQQQQQPPAVSPAPASLQPLASPSRQEPGPVEAPNRPSPAGRSISASDFVAPLLGKQVPSPAPPPVDFQASPPPAEPISSNAGKSPSTPATDNTQEMLLSLLNRPKPAQEKTGNTVEPEKSSSQSSSTPVTDTPAPSSLPPKQPLFTYDDPFEKLAAASPRKKTPQPKARSPAPVVQLAKGKHAEVATRTESPPAVAKPPVGPSEPQPQKPQQQQQKQQQPEDGSVKENGLESGGKGGGKEKELSEVALSSLASQIEDIASDGKKNGPGADLTAEEISKEINKLAAEGEKDIAAGNLPQEETEKGQANGNAAEAPVDSWEKAEDSAAKEERVIPIHNFPIRPFLCITIKANPGKLPSFRDDGIMDIARLKKEFDPLDRSLTSATSDYIVYALAKNGGVRIIRQDDGSDKQIFRSARDRIINVCLCSTSPVSSTPTDQTILAVGVSGTVYYAMISHHGKDLFEMDALESESLVFPPITFLEDSSNGSSEGQVKTRAKGSTRHPEYFAITRGKNIYVVPPRAAMNPAYSLSGVQRSVNTEKFFAERVMKVAVGKAVKDFAFSNDDTVIVSIDRAGRVRFWDVREVIDNQAFLTSAESHKIDVRLPLGTLTVGSPTEKLSPTPSLVLFIDKHRPYAKSIALRYVLVGLDQNHTLQLWDIAIGRVVQEVRFPHTGGPEVICSVTYHPASGIIVVGHPTRNSIYLLHLSAPRYNLPPMSQASFLKRAASEDNELPRAESTACLSGMREISFSSKGQLRSLDLLEISKTPTDKRGVDEESGLFELYVMHSRGVTCLTIKKEDIGWSDDNRMVCPVDAAEAGSIEVTNLQTHPSQVAEERSANGDATGKAIAKEIIPSKPTETRAEEPAKGVAGVSPREVSPAKIAPTKKAAEEQPENGFTWVSDKQEKKKRKKALAATSESATAVKVNNNDTTWPAGGESRAPSYTQVAKEAAIGQEANGSDVVKPTTEQAVQADRFTVSAPGHDAGSHQWNKLFNDLQASLSSEFNKSLGREFGELSRRFDEDRRTRDAAVATEQDKALQVVSKTLSDNIEKNFARVVDSSVQSRVVPTVGSAAAVAVRGKLDEVVSQQLGSVVSRELRQSLPDAVGRSIKQPSMMANIIESISHKLAPRVENEIHKTLKNTIIPSFTEAAVGATEKIGSDLEKQLQAQMKNYEIQRQNDSAKIDQLTRLVGSLSDTVSSMAASQTSFQGEILKLNRIVSSQQVDESRAVPPTPQPQSQPQPPVQQVAPAPSGSFVRPADAPRQKEAELTEIARLMAEGRFEEGTIKVRS